MQEVKFDTEFLNEYFRQAIGKEKFEIEDIKRLPKTIIYGNHTKITQHDVDILEVVYQNVQYEEFDVRGLKIYSMEINNLNEATDEDIEEINNMGTGRIVINSFRGLTTEIFDKLNSEFKYHIKNDFLADQRYSYTYYTRQEMKDILLEMEEIKSFIPKGASDIQKFVTVYKYIGMQTYVDIVCANKAILEYKSESFSSSKEHKAMDRVSRSLKGALIDRRAVCAGYAVALEKCLDYVGIESRFVVGKKDTSHAWNQIKIDGRWYHADLTGDQRDIKNGRSLKYCLKSDKFLKENGYIIERYNLEKSDLDEIVEKCRQDYPKDDEGNILGYENSKLEEYLDDLRTEHQIIIMLQDYKKNAKNRLIDKNLLENIKGVINDSTVIENSNYK